MAKQPTQLSIDDIAKKKAELAKQMQELELIEEEVITSSRQQAIDELASILNKYKLSGVHLLSALMENDFITYKNITDTNPVVLVRQKVMKDKKGSNEQQEGFFEFYKGKTILADMKLAEDLCKKPWAEFMTFVTEDGKKEKNIPVVKDFYNKYCSAEQKQA